MFQLYLCFLNIFLYFFSSTTVLIFSIDVVFIVSIILLYFVIDQFIYLSNTTHCNNSALPQSPFTKSDINIKSGPVIGRPSTNDPFPVWYNTPKIYTKEKMFSHQSARECCLYNVLMGSYWIFYRNLMSTAWMPACILCHPISCRVLKALRLVFRVIVTIHEPVRRCIRRTVRTSQSALWQETPTDRSWWRL